ncbi:conserved hypothetical protein [Ricinus communis]|uniref:Uncharacterized protein n=1 Tax=Ricinus communis TaxID=3988 RepID=B9TGM9_RICCO|nr:conserved hypothetical protein [Ricinus communis]
MQRDQQRTAADRQPQLWQDRAEEHPPGAKPERSGSILDRRIETAKCCGNRQVEEGIISKHRDENAALQPAHAGHEADPGIAVNEGGNGEWRDRKPRPEPRKGDVGTFRQPRQRDRKRDRQRDCQRFQEHRVDHQLADARAEDERLHGFPADIVGDPGDEAERHEAEERDDGCEDDDGSVRHAPAQGTDCADRRFIAGKAGHERSVVLQQGRRLCDAEKGRQPPRQEAVAMIGHAVRFS